MGWLEDAAEPLAEQLRVWHEALTLHLKQNFRDTRAPGAADKAAYIIYFLAFVILLGFSHFVYLIKQRLSGPFEQVRVLGASKGERAVEVTMQWCGGCGFQDKAEAAETLILEKYPSRVRIVSQRDYDRTNNFEITINGLLVHSLRTKRHGFLHNNPERQASVFAAIDVALEELDEENEVGAAAQQDGEQSKKEN